MHEDSEGRGQQQQQQQQQQQPGSPRHLNYSHDGAHIKSVATTLLLFLYSLLLAGDDNAVWAGRTDGAASYSWHVVRRAALRAGVWRQQAAQ